MFNISADSINIIGIVGSPRTNSISSLAAQEVMNGCTGLGINTQIIELHEIQFVDQAVKQMEHMDIYRLRQCIAKSDALVLSCPEQNNSYSELFHQLFEVLSNTVSLENKIVVCIGTGSNIAIGGAYALIKMLETCQRLKAYPLSSSIFIPKDDLIMSHGSFVSFSKITYQRLQNLGHELVFRVRQAKIHAY